MNISKLLKDRRILLGGLGLGIFYWFFEAIVFDVLLFREGTVGETVLPFNDPDELWGRTAAVGLLVILGLIAQILVNRNRKANAALRESQEIFRTVFEDAATGTALISPDGRYFRVNSILSKMLGYTQEELLDKTYQQITHPEDLQASVDQHQRVLEGEQNTFSMEKRLIRADGSPVWVSAVGYLPDPHRREAASVAGELYTVRGSLGPGYERSRTMRGRQSHNARRSKLLKEL